MMPWTGVIEAYKQHIPLESFDNLVTLNEGNTPLIKANKLAREIGAGQEFSLYLKYEGLNPTGSFKDRGMTVAITEAVQNGARAVICASTGNTAASAAAYAARAGLRCAVLIPEGNIALGKLSAALAYGAEVLAIDDSFDRGLELVRDIVQKRPIVLVNSLNPWRIEGQKTGAFEICDQLGGRAPDWHCLPVGNAGNITAYWKGYKEFGKGLPRLLGAQAEGAAPIVHGKKVEAPETIATAIRIGNPARWREAVQALDESGGLITAVSDEQIVEAWRLLAQTEGIFVEPASAAGIAALKQQIACGAVEVDGMNVAAVLTGHGLKDPGLALDRSAQPAALPAKLHALEAHIDRLLG